METNQETKQIGRISAEHYERLGLLCGLYGLTIRNMTERLIDSAYNVNSDTLEILKERREIPSEVKINGKEVVR